MIVLQMAFLIQNLCDYRAKKIVNNAVVNEDPNAKLIRELQAEVKQLRELLKSHVTDTVLNEKLDQVGSHCNCSKCAEGSKLKCVHL